MSTPNVEVKSFKLLPPAPDVCPVCATAHAESDPHNKSSLFYQYGFYAVHQRWPTWDDAMEHCNPETQARWRAALAERNAR